jgi:hypothetical protein
MEFRLGTINLAVVDSAVTRFYEQLGEIFSNWTPLEDVYYRNTEFSDQVELTKFTEVTKWPDIDFFHVTMSKNGGPIALMIMDNVLYIGLKEIKSYIFVLSGLGKKITCINISEVLKIPRERLRWAALNFTPDEDLCLISADGKMYIIDPLSGEAKDALPLGDDFNQRAIVDAKLYEYTLVFRDTNNRFFYIPNITQSAQPMPFEYAPQLANATISDYLLIPKSSKGASSMQLLVADPVEGVWIISDKKVTIKKQIDDSPSFGKVQFMALNAKKELLAMYCEPNTKGRIIVMKADLAAEFN